MCRLQQLQQGEGELGCEGWREFPPGILWDAGKVKREKKGLRTLDKREMGEGVQSPICSLLVGLGEDRLEFEICTSTLLPWPRVPFLLLAKSLSLAASHLQESIRCMDCTQTTAFTALKGLSTAPPGTVCTAKIHHTPFSLPCPWITVFAILQHLWGGWHISPSRYK